MFLIFLDGGLEAEEEEEEEEEEAY